MASSSFSSRSNLKILFIETEKELIGVDFKQLLLQPKWPTINAAPIYFKINLLNFFNGKGIVGMKHVKLGSDVFLIGGESLKCEAIPNKSYVFDNPNSYLGSSSRILHLSFKKNTFSLDRTSHIQRLLYGKCSPIAENIGGKIYVLEGKSYFHDHNLEGTFEVYDHEIKSCLLLPLPYKNYPQGKIDGHFVLGHKFIVFEKKDYKTIDGYFYDTLAYGDWKKLNPNVIFSYTQAGLPLPINGMCVPFFPPLKDHGLELILIRKGIEEAYALLINESYGTLLCYQPLRVVFPMRFPLTETGQRAHLNNGRNFFFVLPNNEICAIWIAFDHHKKLRLFATKFSLQLFFNPIAEILLFSPSHPIKSTFLELFDNHSWDCVVKNDEASSIFDAFFFEK